MKPSTSHALSDRCRHRLEPWIKAARDHLYIPPERPDLMCYGSGYNGWGVQTNQKAFAAFAVLATDPRLETSRTGMSADELADNALRLLRFSLASHDSGDFHCLDGRPWGHTWISALGIERMMHAVDELWDHMSAEDHEALRRVLLSESDWLVDRYQRKKDAEPGKVQAGLTQHNDPESNLWNGILLHRTAMLYPDTPRATEYKLQGTRFILNGISVPSDAESRELFEGAPLADWHLGANFFPSFALNHHGYLNLGYMIICLSQVAMAHFDWKSRGLTPPAGIYLHVEELWRTVKKMIAPDGRLLRIGGDTRVRYCYCQDYAVPAWLLILDHLLDTDCIGFEQNWLSTLEREVEAGDGQAFLTARLKAMNEISPTYYTRLESDRAAALSMALCWRRRFDDFNSIIAGDPIPSEGGWHDQYHGACLIRGKRRFASWCWRAAAPPQGLCLPIDHSDMAEWQVNLAGCVNGVGARNFAEVVKHNQRQFPGGFINFGICNMRSENNLAEGETDKTVARQHIAFAALPEDAGVICIQYAAAVNRAFVRTVKGLHLMMPNDIFNGCQRIYFDGSQQVRLPGVSDSEEVLKLNSNWVNIDDCLTVASLDKKPLSILRPGRRQVEILKKPLSFGSLYADEICSFYQSGLRSYDSEATILDTTFTLRVGEDSRTARQRQERIVDHKFGGDNWRGAMCEGADGNNYLLLLNLDSRDNWAEVPLTSNRTLHDLGTGRQAEIADRGYLPLAPEEARLLVLE